MACFVHQRGVMQEAVQLLLACRRCRYGGDSGCATRGSYQRLANITFFSIQKQPLATMFSLTMLSVKQEVVSKFSFQPIIDEVAYQKVMVTMAWMIVVFVPLLNHRVSSTGQEMTAEEHRPLPVWLPFEVHNSPFYEFTYTVQVLWLAFVAETSISVDCVFVNLMLMITAELHILNSTLSTLQEDSVIKKGPVVTTNQITEDILSYTNRSWIHYSKQLYEKLISVEGTDYSPPDMCENSYAKSEKKIKQEMYQHLLQNVQHHQTVIKCIVSAQKAMNLSVFVLLSTNIIEICSSIFGTVELLKNDMPAAAMKTLCMIPLILSQSGMYCFFGQMISDESEKLVQSAYTCDWYEGDIHFNRVLLILMIRATEPLKITVGKTMSLSRQTFLQVLNGAYALLNMAYHVNN